MNSTEISYGLVSSENVKVVVYNSLGAEVSVLADEAQTTGAHKINWNTASVEKGLYTVVVKTATGAKSTRIAVQ